MATIKAYMTPLRRRADEEYLADQQYAPPAVGSMLGGNRNSSGAPVYTAPVYSRAGSFLEPQRYSQGSGVFGRGAQGVLGGYTPPQSGATGAKPSQTPAAGSTETPAAGMGVTGDIATSATAATGLPNNSYQYADMYGDANTLLAYKALPEYLSAQGLRNQGMSETAWLAIRNGYQPPQAASGSAGGAGGGGKPLSAMEAIRRGSGKDRSWLQEYSDIDYDYSAPVAAPSGGGTPVVGSATLPGYEDTLADKQRGVDAYYRNGEMYLNDGTTRGATANDVANQIYRQNAFAGVSAADYNTALAQVPKNKDGTFKDFNSSMINILETMGYKAKIGDNYQVYLYK